MRKSSIVWAVVATSCALPEFGVVSSFDDASGGSGASSSGSPSSSGAAGKAGSNGGKASGGSESMAGEATAGNPSGGSDFGGGSSGTSSVGQSGAPAEAGAPTDGGATNGGAGGEPISCTTPPLLDACHGKCVDTNSDEKHCGQCDKPCGANAECQSGTCGCVVGTIKCNDACVRDDTPEYCGSCTNHCTGAQDCAGTTCKICPTGCAVLGASTAKFFDFAWFAIDLNPTANLNNATIHIRLYPFKGQDVAFMMYVVNSDDKAALATWYLNEVTGWTDLSFKVVPDPPGYDFPSIKQLAFGLEGLDNPANPSSVYIDSISVDSNVFGPFNFAANSAPLNKLSDSFNTGMTTVASTLTWLGN
ncbi:MAG: hypothetical protein ABUL60_00510 [Myxococcales bacterium]